MNFFISSQNNKDLKLVKLDVVPEVLNVHMNKIYKKLTTIKFKKLEFKSIK